MRLGIARTVLTILTWVFVSSCGAGQSDSSVAAPINKHALLIAVSDYKNTPFRTLRGPERDVSLVAEILTKRFRMPRENITVLINKDATHTKIQRAFEDLSKRVRKGDFVYIHYAGHGSTTPDAKELRGEAQTWVPFGART